MKTTPDFYCGASGLVLPVPNKSHYPEEYRDKSRLTYYASLFTSIEINSSFYRIPQRKTIEKWTEMVPDHFRFSFKLFKDITHKKKLAYLEKDLDLFLTAIDGAGGKRGCLLIQLPGGTKSSEYSALEHLLEDISRHPLAEGWNLAVELRDTSWYMAETWELLNEFGAALVYQDIPKSVTPRIEMRSKNIYLRYHGPTGNYRGSYSETKLKNESIEIATWLTKGKTVFAYFNNTMGEAFKNLQWLNNLVRGQAATDGN